MEATNACLAAAVTARNREARELTLTIRCQSPSNKIDMKSDISYEGGRLSGHWSERNFGLEGDVEWQSGGQ